MSAPTPSAFLSVRGRSVEYQRIAAAAAGPTLVFLHEGLGSISQWRDFPARIVEGTGLPAIVYARYGHGSRTCCCSRTAWISCTGRRWNPCLSSCANWA